MTNDCFLSRKKLETYSLFFNIIRPVNIPGKIRKFLLALLLISIVFVNLEAAVSPPDNTARHGVVIDAETSQVLYDKAMDVKAFPASLTKVLTTIIALEEANLDDIVTVSRKAAYQEGSSIYLSEGEKISLEELLYALMLASGNDAAVAVAEHISDTVEDFAILMNEKAKMMGALNSNFTNPHGLPDHEHYSTAYDMGMIMRYALKNKKFREISQCKNKTISWSDNDWGRGLRNHNKLLFSYDDITGGKTGYTKAAGRCLVSSASRDGREVIAVVLNDPNDWLNVRALLDYGLNNFKKKALFEKGEIVYKLIWEESKESELNIILAEGIELLVPEGGNLHLKKEVFLDPELELPIKKGDRIGYLRILEDDRELKKVELLANNDLNYNSIFLRFWAWLTNSSK